MMTSIILLLVLTAVFFITISVFALIYNASHSESLYHNWTDEVYDFFFKNKKPEHIAKLLKVKVHYYVQNCKLCGIEPHLKKVVIYRIIGFILFFGLYFVAIFLKEWLLFIAGFFALYFLVLRPISVVNQKVNHMRISIGDELPRFLDMFYTALIVNIPPEQALELTADSLPNMTLSKEIKRALADVRMGSRSWQDSLKTMALEYNQEMLTDFILDLLNAHNTGSSISESVKRTSTDIKRANMLDKKERANKLSNTIMLPIMAFKMIPLIVILGIPVIYQLF